MFRRKTYGMCTFGIIVFVLVMVAASACLQKSDNITLNDKIKDIEKKGIMLPEKLPDSWIITLIEENYTGFYYENYTPVVRVIFENPEIKVNIPSRTGGTEDDNASVELYFIPSLTDK